MESCAPPEPQCGALLFRVTLKSVANSPSQPIPLEIPGGLTYYLPAIFLPHRDSAYRILDHDNSALTHAIVPYVMGD